MTRTEAPLSSEGGAYLITAPDWRSIRHFRAEEFQCRCCNSQNISAQLVSMLDAARKIAGVPFRINSGYRCEKHNREIGGSPTSSHMKGLAADISATDHALRFRIVYGLLQAGFRRIVIYRDKQFIHVDIDPDKPQDIMPIQ